MYLRYPMKTMNISQNYKGSYSHSPAYTGSPQGFPIDDCGADTGRDYVYAPCDCTIKRIYGVGASGTNTIWLESTEQVELANGNKSYVTIQFTHPNDDDLVSLKVGQTFKQGDKMFREGTDGQATGNHVEIQVSNAKFSGNGWVKNSKGGWVIKNAIKPEDAFYVDDTITIQNANGITFKTYTSTSSTTTTTSTTSYYAKTTYTGNSIVDALKSISVDSSFSNREKIAKANGISNYTGTATQNTTLLNLLKQGKLKKA